MRETERERKRETASQRERLTPECQRERERERETASEREGDSK